MSRECNGNPPVNQTPPSQRHNYLHVTFIGPCIVIYIYSKTTRCTSFSNLFISFRINTLHVSDGLSVHHQEFKTVPTATITCLTYTSCCLYGHEPPDDGRKDRPKHVEC
jgi:hypothetical protein